MTRRAIWQSHADVWLFGLLSLLSLCSCQRGTEPGRHDRAHPLIVQIGYQKTGAPFLLKERATQLEQRLEREGAQLRWIEFQAGPPLLEAMRGGSVDIGYTGEAPPIFAQSGGVPLVYVAADPPSPRAEAILVRADSPIRSVADLKGRRVALNRGSNVHYLLLRALESSGLGIDSVETLYLAPPDARSAFESGSVDAWVIWDPFLAAAERKGARVLRNGEGLVDNRQFYLARRSFAEQQAKVLALVLEEFANVSRWAKSHAEEASRQLSAASGIPYEALLLAEGRHNYGVIEIDATILAKQQVIADAFLTLKIIPQPIRTVDAQLAQSVRVARKP